MTAFTALMSDETIIEREEEGSVSDGIVPGWFTAVWLLSVMYYDQPARNWHESLPMGNGRLGATVYGGTKKETLALNEDTLWSYLS